MERHTRKERKMRLLQRSNSKLLKWCQKTLMPYRSDGDRRGEMKCENQHNQNIFFCSLALPIWLIKYLDIAIFTSLCKANIYCVWPIWVSDHLDWVYIRSLVVRISVFLLLPFKQKCTLQAPYSSNCPFDALITSDSRLSCCVVPLGAALGGSISNNRSLIGPLRTLRNHHKH